MPGLHEKQPGLPKFVMKNFLDPLQKSTEAIVDGHTGETLTYEQVYAQTYSLAHHLRTQLNCKPGDIIAIMSPNHINYFSAFNGIALTGAASTTINPLYVEEEVRYQLDLTKAKAIIAHSMCLSVALAASGGKIPVIHMGAGLGEAKGAEGKSLSKSKADLSLADMLTTPLRSVDTDSFLPASGFDAESMVTVPFSSGTTGRAKGVMLSHR